MRYINAFNTLVRPQGYIAIQSVWWETPQGTFKRRVFVKKSRMCECVFTAENSHFEYIYSIFEHCKPLAQFINDSVCTLVLFLNILYCICTACLVANKGPVKLGLCLPGGCFAVPLHNCTGLPCQLSKAPWARHEASQHENKGHNH